MPFLTKKLVVQEVDSRRWSITTPLVYKGKDQTWTVRRGFVTDFATVPKIAVWLIPVYGLYTKAAILHDWFCSYAIQAGLISGRDADGVFRRIMREEGVDYLTRWIIWTGVRWGAFLNPVRREGWWRDAWRVLPITLFFAPVVLPTFAFVGLGLAVWALLELVFLQIRRGVGWWHARSSGRSSTRR